MLNRTIQSHLLDALSDTPVVLLNGARQTGKSTLVQAINTGATYITLDDPGALAAVTQDPAGFIAAQNGHIILDEIQRAPGIFPLIKQAVDRHRSPGQFLLTGSANVLLLPDLADSLAGRMEVLPLWPLSQSELERTPGGFIDRLFDTDINWPVVPESDTPNTLYQRAFTGGFPEMTQRRRPQRQRAWLENYLTTILYRDVRDLAQIERLTELPNLLRVLAARSGTLLNLAELSRSVGLTQTTLKRYMTLLETLFLVARIPAWHSNRGKRLQKSPKIILCDTGLLAWLLDMDAMFDPKSGGLPGPLTETFVLTELKKLISWSETQPRLMHYRTSTGFEVDAVLENRRGQIVGMEIKSTATLNTGHLKGLKHLKEAAGPDFLRGVVLYGGNEVVRFAPDLTAVPISMLWHL